jgi:hypothetical protein
MKQYVPKQSEKIVSFLSRGYTNGSNIIIALYGEGIFVLKRVYTGQNIGEATFKWVALKTGYGYNLNSCYENIEAACDGLVKSGARVILLEEYRELFELLENNL